MAELIVALDVPSPRDAYVLVERLGDDVDFYKVGAHLFTAAGPEVIRHLRVLGKRVFLDLKFHDIPNTVARAVEAAGALGVEMLTLHASGGSAMMREARQAAGDDGPRLLAVTILTSFSAQDILEVWGKELRSVREEVARLAALAAAADMHGVVASALEVESLRRKYGPDFLLATPGIRIDGGGAGDQVRIATPAQAARAGADLLIVGRPIYQADDPAGAVRRIRAEMETALETAAG
jgi:orotidine-5'-phosphate decarboxylase